MMQHTRAPNASSCHNKHLSQGEGRGFFHKAFTRSPISRHCRVRSFPYRHFSSQFFSRWSLHNVVECPEKNPSMITNLFSISIFQDWYFFVMGSQSFLYFSLLLQTARVTIWELWKTCGLKSKGSEKFTPIDKWSFSRRSSILIPNLHLSDHLWIWIWSWKKEHFLKGWLGELSPHTSSPHEAFFIFFLYYFDVSVFCNSWVRKRKSWYFFIKNSVLFATPFLFFNWKVSQN